VSFPFHSLGTPEHRADLPGEVDLIVIGGGVLGICTALYANRRGLKVLVLEKGRVAGEQSSRNWGWIRVQGRDMAEIPIALEAQELWTALEAECGGRLGLRQRGTAYLARDAAGLEGFEGWLEEARPLGVSSRMLDRAATEDLMAVRNGPWAGALYTPTDCQAEPWVAVPELARLAVSEGVMIRESCAVRGLDIAAGQVAGVLSEEGVVKAAQVLVAGGAWSSLLLRRHGINLPQLMVRSSVYASGVVDPGKGVGLPDVGAADDRLALRPRLDGGYSCAPAAYSELFVGPDSLRHLKFYLPLLKEGSFEVKLRPAAPKGFPDGWGTPRRWDLNGESPFERMRILDPAPHVGRLGRLKRDLATLWPEFGVAGQATQWAGMIDVLPDVVPVADRVSALPGLMVATGMCGHGFGIGPGFGRVLADMAAGDAPGHDLSRFRLSRFSDGSRLVPGPNI
jgi:glycine/D-amino acid oxidase-like deaminating enzyme